MSNQNIHLKYVTVTESRQSALLVQQKTQHRLHISTQHALHRMNYTEL